MVQFSIFNSWLSAYETRWYKCFSDRASVAPITIEKPPMFSSDNNETVAAIRCSIVVSIRPCHGRDPGSIPGNGTFVFPFPFFFFFFFFLFPFASSILLFRAALFPASACEFELPRPPTARSQARPKPSPEVPPQPQHTTSSMHPAPPAFHSQSYELVRATLVGVRPRPTNQPSQRTHARLL
jgi:hypothetical protein